MGGPQHLTSSDASKFCGPPEEHVFSCLLFDMDGTIIDSTPAIEKYWAGIGAQIGVDPATILATSHGRRSIDTLQILAPHLANWDYITAEEGKVPKLHGSDATEIPGARPLLDSLTTASIPWAIVTSGTLPLVTGWLERMALSQPPVLVTAEQVPHGKPDPACYALGAERLGLGLGAAAEQGGAGPLVLEDAPSGVRAGKAAGFRVVAVETSHAAEQLRAAGADWIVRDLRSVRVVGWDWGRREVRIEIRDALVL